MWTLSFIVALVATVIFGCMMLVVPRSYAFLWAIPSVLALITAGIGWMAFA